MKAVLKWLDYLNLFEFVSLINQVSEAKNSLSEENDMCAFIYTACILFPQGVALACLESSSSLKCFWYVGLKMWFP